MTDNSAAQKIINEALEELECWNATLPFYDVEGLAENEHVDLFTFTDKNLHPRKDFNPNPKVIFDRKKYPPTQEGLSSLKTNIMAIAQLYGTILTKKSDALSLVCQQSRPCKPKKKTLVDTQTPLELPLQNFEEDTYDQDGVKIGIREYYYHRDNAHRRKGGKSSVKGCSTVLPLTREETCKVSLRFDIQNTDPNGGFIYLKEGCGCAKHTSHPKEIPGHRALTKRLCPEETRKLIENGVHASVGGGSLRNLIRIHQNSFVSRGTMQSMRLEPP